MDLEARKRVCWRPIFDPEERAEFYEVIDAILMSHTAPLPEEAGNIVGGIAGLALWRAQLELAMPKRGHGDVARLLLSQACDLLDDRIPWLDCGFTGLAWMNTHLAHTLYQPDSGDDSGDANEQVDLAVLDLLAQSPWPGDVGLFFGLVGFGVYALEHIQHPNAVLMLEAIVARLHETAYRDNIGISWFRSSESLGGIARFAAPRGFYDLGVAHGLSGVIGLLAELCARDIERGRAQVLLDGAVAWLLAHQRSGTGSRFPRWIEPGVPASDAPGCRSAWCNGDPGIAVVLYNAGTRLNLPRWQAIGLELARAAATRTDAESGVVDACLCHGTAGLAHIFNRLYQSSQDPLFRDAARAWFRRTLTMRHPGVGVGGFRSWTSADCQVDDPGFLMGASGIGLAILAAITDAEPTWDRLLLLSFP
jgi:hypothetical protein